ncbi:MAG: hypothetical protein A2821_02145 [Candidatus Magasanikbacteria bacterium RIFCSPHIGHO2_01_FULL_41_23]|uniref:DNA recombination protein RmuC n=1 Tax=Candidatus Magasanikbacteria bacterium RIFCSPLOWO2_01_FULL_40_15 TaxID=1798686 RepID=A0A1F6N3E9_9BACT|nr:MAG: hypothetical protein A2821_02145 [Candidatus Magasanikbacteria bacterium RIFCSPHIGHO2_01_FULL_41_23]OGH76447.1 MAG: hypothetical protein A3F22_00650 [Candidatus Magasanikbacteria bacterium RIFCSPHIGHO2_12_FULL_41_16]OGH78404.1 MAG: hypothetical protein A2983_02605 [Candidatus Magasanikbacteria bacterium RIFCSPLOWO2_01_FULL_40_15]
MENVFLYILFFLSSGLIIFILILLRRLKSQGLSTDNNSRDTLFLLQQQVQELNKVVDQKMSESFKLMRDTQENVHKTLQDQFGQNTNMIQNITGQSHRMIANITEKLTSLDKTNQQVVNFSEQLGNLEKILKHQKQRGNLGEAGLRLVLENLLPPTAFELQYQFPDGDTVDAAIKTKEGLICVDAKFSLDNYERLIHEDDETQRQALENEFKKDLKKRIDETAKYIKPKYGTLEFAFMFIPAEAIYYDLLVNEVGAVKVNTRSLIEYAFVEKKVIIVSPTTFAAYLHTVVQGLQALKIEEGAKSIRKNVEALQKHLLAYEDYMKKLANSMGTSVNHLNSAYREFGKIDKDIVRISGGEQQIEILQIEHPKTNQERDNDTPMANTITNT